MLNDNQEENPYPEDIDDSVYFEFAKDLLLATAEIYRLPKIGQKIQAN